MSIYLLPKTVIKEMDKVRRTFFWQGGHSRRKYHLVRWTKICKSNKKGGPGHPSSRISGKGNFQPKSKSFCGLWQMRLS